MKFILVSIWIIHILIPLKSIISWTVLLLIGLSQNIWPFGIINSKHQILMLKRGTLVSSWCNWSWQFFQLVELKQMDHKPCELPNNSQRKKHLFDAIESKCKSYVDILPFASNSDKLSATNFKQQWHLVQFWTCTYLFVSLIWEFAFKVFWRVHTSYYVGVRERSKKDNARSLSNTFAYAPKWMLNLLAGAPIVPFFGTYIWKWSPL